MIPEGISGNLQRNRTGAFIKMIIYTEEAREGLLDSGFQHN